jgi:hypothetical protein
VHDALKRRCLYHWVDYPDFDRELDILRKRVPEATETLSAEIVAFVHSCAVRTCSNPPAWPKASTGRVASWRWTPWRCHRRLVTDTVGALLKYQDDIARIAGAETTRLWTRRAAASRMWNDPGAGSRTAVWSRTSCISRKPCGRPV